MVASSRVRSDMLVVESVNSTTNANAAAKKTITYTMVLGFRKREVNHYVNKETVLLTIIGVVLGIPAGYAFSHMLTYVLKMPSIYFAVLRSC